MLQRQFYQYLGTSFWHAKVLFILHPVTKRRERALRVVVIVMDRNGIVAMFVLFFIVADVSNARFRDLAVAPENETANPVSDSNNKPDQKPVGGDESKEIKSPKKVEPLSNSTQSGLKQLNDTDSKTSNLPIEGAKDGKRSSDSNSGSQAVEIGTTGKEKNPKGSHSSDKDVIDSSVNNTNRDNGKNSKSSDSTDSAMSQPGNKTNTRDSDGGTNSTTGDSNVTKNSNKGDSNGGTNSNKGDLDGVTSSNTGDSKGGTNLTKSDEDKSSSEVGVSETCLGLPNRCTVNTLTACIKSFDTGSGKLSVLVQNEGEENLRAKLTIPSAIENRIKQLEVSKNQTQMINILLTVSVSPKVILNAENRECLLHLDPLESEENVFMHFPSYDKLVTPVNGAYFLVLSVLMFGGTWACCKFRKRKWHDGVPYQELEMGLPESVSGATVESAEGWDQGWDDDWDEDNAVKSPGAPHVGNISANGLTSRTSNRDGWEHDWDD